MKTETELTTFFLSFVGQKIAVTVGLTLSGEQGETPLFYEGVLLDYDDDYYFLGSSPEEITQAIKKTDVVHIMLSDDKTMYQSFLEQMPGPSTEEDVN